MTSFLPKKFDSLFLQRLVLAFTTGLFLACAAGVSNTQAAEPTPASAAAPASEMLER